MRNNHKFVTLPALATIAGGIIYGVNKIIASEALISDVMEKPKSNSFYNWRFGKIYYTKIGAGKPILLVHDAVPGGSDYEWYKIRDNLSRNHTVYTIDLLGCGRSEKPAMTYTNFVYSQLLCDFSREIIGETTDIIATGLSGSIAVTACNINKEQYDQCILINPTEFGQLNRIPTKNTKAQKLLLELPVIGTMLYNIFTSMFHVEHVFMEEYFYNPFHMDRKYMEAYHEAAHMADGSGKYLYASLVGGYLNFNIQHSLQSINNSIVIVSGSSEPNAKKTAENYKKYNPSIEHLEISKSKHFPHIEQKEEFLKQIEIYLEK